ncbi:MAG: restriction endonuclease subunit S [Anoxybacillus gonensis]|nr:restriction endonuclease subunit S [Anoxybacillus gonensis]
MSKTKQKPIDELLKEALVPEDEQPYQVPENWVWTWTGVVHEIVTGSTPSKRNSEYYGGTFPFVKPGDLEQEDSIVEASEYLTDQGKKKNRIIPRHSTLVCCIGSIGKVGFNLVECTTNQQINSLVPDKKAIYPKYTYYFSLSPVYQSLLKASSSSTTVSIINKSKMSKLKFVLPPLNEQKRIVDKIERLFAKIDEAKRLIEEVKESVELQWESILYKAFRGDLTEKWRSGSSIIENADDVFNDIQKIYKKRSKEDEPEIIPPYPIPQSWKWVKLGDIVEINPSRKKFTDIADDQNCTFIPMPSVSDKTGEIENYETRKYGEVKKGYTFFLENDILFAKITPCMENGKTAIAQNLINGFGFGSTEFHVIRTNHYVNTKLIYYLLRSKKFRAEAKKEMTGAVGQQRVPKSFLENYLVPLPPKAEQDKIVELLDKLYFKESEIKSIESLEKELDSLRQSILSKAFRGELGTNDPNDEHAMELLKEALKSK